MQLRPRCQLPPVKKWLSEKTCLIQGFDMRLTNRLASHSALITRVEEHGGYN